MLPQLPDNREIPRIVHLFPERTSESVAPSPEAVTMEQRLREARHFLKFMLPGVPIVVFVMSFVFGYVVVGVHTTPPDGGVNVPLDPAQPLLGAFLLALATGVFCSFIYWGFVRITTPQAPQ